MLQISEFEAEASIHSIRFAEWDYKKFGKNLWITQNVNQDLRRLPSKEHLRLLMRVHSRYSIL